MSPLQWGSQPTRRLNICKNVPYHASRNKQCTQTSHTCRGNAKDKDSIKDKDNTKRNKKSRRERWKQLQRSDRDLSLHAEEDMIILLPSLLICAHLATFQVWPNPPVKEKRVTSSAGENEPSFTGPIWQYHSLWLWLPCHEPAVQAVSSEAELLNN